MSPLWGEYLANLTEARTLRPRRVADLDEKSLRRAALHTGALEGLHPADQGVTVTIVSHDAWRQAVAIEAGEETVGHVDASLQASDLALDLASGANQLSEASVRALHALATGFQQTYEARVLVGGQWMRQDGELPRGQYKVQPNHVPTADGTFHSHAPVSRVSDEVRRLIAEIDTAQFARAHPAVQAAFAHHALVAVHPFADGNGRVARLLASVFLLRVASVPLTVFADQKAEYLGTLRSADRGDPRPFVRFVEQRALDAMAWVTQELFTDTADVEAPELKSPDDISSRETGLSRLRNALGNELRAAASQAGGWHDLVWTVEETTTDVRHVGRHRFAGYVGGFIVCASSETLGAAFGRPVFPTGSRRRQEYSLGLFAELREGAVHLDIREPDVYPELRGSGDRADRLTRPTCRRRHRG